MFSFFKKKKILSFIWRKLT